MNISQTWRSESRDGRPACVQIDVLEDHYRVAIFWGDSLDACALKNLMDAVCPDATASIPRERTGRIEAFLHQNQLALPAWVAKALGVTRGRA